jgi:protein ImuA
MDTLSLFADPPLPPGGALVPRSTQPLVRVDPELIHPELWRGHQLGHARQETVPSGWPALDRELPSGGWPRRVLTELLMKQPGVGEIRLLAPALCCVASGSAATGPGGAGRRVMLVDPPAVPCAWALAQLGLDEHSLIVVHGREGPRGAALRHLLASADLLWVLEQALRSGHVGAIVAWLPDRLRADALRRLQLAAQCHDGPVFLMRGIDARLKPSPAPLRLALHAAQPDAIDIQLLKRRGPPRPQMLRLTLPAPTGLRRPAPSVSPGQQISVSQDSAFTTV